MARTIIPRKSARSTPGIARPPFEGPRVGGRLMDARPDRLDIRDLPYRPPLRSLPPAYPDDATLTAFVPGYVKAGLVLDQGREGACTGFGLACVVNYLLYTRDRFIMDEQRVLDAIESAGCRPATRPLISNE